jgi:hypothetical protein
MTEGRYIGLKMMHIGMTQFGLTQFGLKMTRIGMKHIGLKRLPKRVTTIAAARCEVKRMA